MWHSALNGETKSRILIQFLSQDTSINEFTYYKLYMWMSTKTNSFWHALLSHKNRICTFMRCRHLTYDTWIWLKITSLSSRASDLSLEIPSIILFGNDLFSKHQNKVILAISLLISRP